MTQILKCQKGCRAGGGGQPPATRRIFLAEDKIRIVLEGLHGDESIAELYRKEGVTGAC